MEMCACSIQYLYLTPLVCVNELKWLMSVAQHSSIMGIPAELPSAGSPS